MLQTTTGTNYILSVGNTDFYQVPFDVSTRNTIFNDDFIKTVLLVERPLCC